MTCETPISLYELNAYVKQALAACFPETFWITAETSDVRAAENGHCYLELIEKEEISGSILAKSKANIWKNKFVPLRRQFEQETGQSFTSGIKVLVEVSISFHEAYGYALQIQNISPAYTLGEMQRKRQEIHNRLEREGLLGKNKRTILPPNPQRIAIISSASAAGYQDFIQQLSESSFAFYTRLFPAVMQGEAIESSICKALQSIERQQKYTNCFDATIIIRGGGATTDLNGFDSYTLASAIAHHSLPILTGIGHERDETIPDFVAHTRLKTPTAVAAFLIGRVEICYSQCVELSKKLLQYTRQILQKEEMNLNTLRHTLPQAIEKIVHRQQLYLATILPRLNNYAEQHKERSLALLHQIEQRIVLLWRNKKEREEQRLDHFKQLLDAHSPEHIFRRGFSIAVCNGKIITSPEQLKLGDQLTTRFSEGEVKSKIIQTKK